jgi:hypothetical protein
MFPSYVLIQIDTGNSGFIARILSAPSHWQLGKLSGVLQVLAYRDEMASDKESASSLFFSFDEYHSPSEVRTHKS